MVQGPNDSESPAILDTLVQSAGKTHQTPFRDRAYRVGSVYTISYSQAIVAMYDYDREQAGGLPKNMFLMAAKPQGDETFILLRIQKEARLPNAAANDQTRQKGVEDSGNAEPWANKLPEWMRDQLSLHAVECSVLGTFIDQGDGKYRYAEDIDNYYAVHELMVWKPDAESLDMIVNHQHRTNEIPIDQLPKRIGHTRFAAAEQETATRADFRLNPTDMLKRRTAYFGMSRSGKSNGLKVVAESVYRLREADPSKYRVGQLIFDLSGEYAQDNPQDGKALHRVHETIGLARDTEVETYGLFKVPWDPERKIMKLNFFGDPIPSPWSTEEVEKALEQLLAGREIIKGIMAHETARYTTAFRDVDISVPTNIVGDTGAQVRYRRAILAYQTALASAGLIRPSWSPSVRGVGNRSLFNDDILDAMSSEKNPESKHKTDYHQAATILRNAKKNQYEISWDQLRTVFTALARFIDDKRSGYNKFEEGYISTSKSGESWADPRLKAVLRIFESQNGPRSFQTAQEQHDPNSTTDFADAVVNDLREGKLVIIDQSGDESDHNRAAAERIMWRVFRAQTELFKKRLAMRKVQEEPTEGHVIVYLEEAHNLLPRANARDNLKTVWARSAKEGSKLSLGMVLATQAPSSVMPEILSETDNWILSYLNSENERRVIAGYMDFADFLEQIGKVSEQGFVRIRTLSQAYTVPVQLDKFRIEDAGAITAPNSRPRTDENGHRANQPTLG